MEYCRRKFIPLEVRAFLPHGWIVGGAAKYLTDHTIPESELPPGLGHLYSIG